MKQILFAFFCFVSLSLVAQDTLRTKQLSEVVVTATRSERTLAELPVPITVITKDQIKSMGSLRLNDVLAEQTGLTIVSDHGTGIQIQGFAPEYTLILIDGEPLIGRTAGTLELSRLAVGNIQQIEIVKGPSSSLYGSEALAGVVNIITEKPSGTNGTVTSRYGTNATADIGATLNYKKEKFNATFFANRYSTDGYDLTPETKISTVDPYYNYTLQSKLNYNFSKRTQLSIAGRYFNEKQNSYTEAAEDLSPLDSKSITEDWNINPVLVHRFSDKLKTTFRFYGSGFGNTTDLTYQRNGSWYDSSFFKQHFYRPEVQAEYFLNSKNIFTLGAGRIWETVEATRYDGKMQYETNYVYLQYEWQPVTKLNLIAGARYDHNTAYAPQLSPKFSAQYEINTWLSMRGSFGVGFRAPDFRQLYLNFTNNTVGYSVFGTQEVEAGIQRLSDRGEIATLLVDPSTIRKIDAESSRAYNLGFTLSPLKAVPVNISFFRNEVSDLIATEAIAQKTNGYFVYSYINISSAVMQGAEVDASWAPSPSISFSAGYQYLHTEDQDVVARLKNGQVFKKDPETNITSRVKVEEYGGLFNRSKHMINAKVFYNHKPTGWEGSFRAIYRGRYGFADLNNSTILDDDSEYVDGYATFNLSVAKNIKQFLRVQVGCDNLFGYTNPDFIAALPGRLLWASAAFTFSPKSKSNKQ
ncbi:MAG: TonB-dependent receptor [Cytophagia bacterium]|nr:TonB-dependent receptor [Cytophagia bacterium]